MKKIVIPILGLLLFAGCTDKELYEPKPIVYADHCSDGILNLNELDTDCGGECAPCGTIAASCSPDTNAVMFAGSTSFIGFSNRVDTFQIHNGGVVNVDNNYVMYGSNTSPTTYIGCNIIVGGTRPTVTRAFNLTNQQGSNTYNDWEARIEFDFPSGTIFSTSGKLYVTPIAGNKLEFTFCGVSFSWINWGNYTTYVMYNNVSGKLRCHN